MRRTILSLIGALVIGFGSPAAAQSPAALGPYNGDISPELQQWYSAIFELYRKEFVEPDGRVVDPQNGSITHSESQGYGMMLALLGNDPRTFDRIWTFARDNMQKANKLFGWKWVPGRGITDWNNATDGELLIATALTIGAERWNRGDYLQAALQIADSVGRNMIIRYGGYTLLLPGNWAAPTGRNGKAVVNMSYFIPLTLKVMEALAPRYDWEGVFRDSIRMLDDSIHPPSDWTEINQFGEPTPATSFPPRFSYDAVRIPLYLLQGEVENEKITEILMTLWGHPKRSSPFPFDVYTMGKVDKFWGKSYELSHDLIHCLETGEPVDWSSLEMKMTNYFDSSLHIMLAASLHASHPQCYPS